MADPAGMPSNSGVPLQSTVDTVNYRLAPPSDNPGMRNLNAGQGDLVTGLADINRVTALVEAGSTHINDLYAYRSLHAALGKAKPATDDCKPQFYLAGAARPRERTCDTTGINQLAAQAHNNLATLRSHTGHAAKRGEAVCPIRLCQGRDPNILRFFHAHCARVRGRAGCRRQRIALLIAAVLA
jgi:hypothetical protein